MSSGVLKQISSRLCRYIVGLRSTRFLYTASYCFYACTDIILFLGYPRLDLLDFGSTFLTRAKGQRGNLAAESDIVNSSDEEGEGGGRY